jgi:hypothetical protein
MSAKTGSLPGMSGEGVAPLSIASIDKAIDKYEQKKEQRCKASPGEIAAKQELLALLHKNRDKLPLNDDGHAFYRYEQVDYVLEETMKRKKVASEGDGAGEE